MSHTGHALSGVVLSVGLLALVGLGEKLAHRRPSVPLSLLAGAGIAAAAIHAVVTPSHWQQAPVYGLFFAVAAAVQLGYSVLVLVRPLPALIAIDAVLNGLLLLLWVQTRVLGVPVGPAVGAREPVGLVDAACAACELVVVVAAGVLLRAARPTRVVVSTGFTAKPS